MRKAALPLIGLLLLVAVMPALAQHKTYPKEAYVVSEHIVAIALHPLGYRLTYLRTDNTWGNLYVPLSWFGNGPDSKADIGFASGIEYPFFSIFWVDGSFDHISIHAPENYQDPSWQVIDPSVDLTAQFNVKEPPRDF